jgi:hypothetical protein
LVINPSANCQLFFFWVRRVPNYHLSIHPIYRSV